MFDEIPEQRHNYADIHLRFSCRSSARADGRWRMAHVQPWQWRPRQQNRATSMDAPSTQNLATHDTSAHPASGRVLRDAMPMPIISSTPLAPHHCLSPAACTVARHGVACNMDYEMEVICAADAVVKCGDARAAATAMPPPPGACSGTTSTNGHMLHQHIR
uniref:Uncharacterized protein n=1 Tax=Arundo donax TaxID=35708 RepID=A0A0A9EY45_ARUDO